MLQVENAGSPQEALPPAPDVRQELKQLATRPDLADARLLLERVLALLEGGQQGGDGQPDGRFALRNETDRWHVQQLLDQFRQLSQAHQAQCPGLLNRLGALLAPSPDQAAPAQDTFLSLLRSFTRTRGYHLAPAIPARPLERAARHFGIPADEYIFALLETTSDSTNPQGLAVGCRGIYYRGTPPAAGQGGGRFLPYDHFACTDFRAVTEGPNHLVDLGAGRIALANASVQGDALSLLMGLSALVGPTPGWQPDLPDDERARREERERLVTEVAPVLLQARRLFEQREQVQLRSGTLVLLLLASLAFLALGASLFVPAWPLLQTATLLGRLALVPAFVVPYLVVIVRSRRRQKVLDATANVGLLAGVTELEASIAPQLDRLAQLDRDPWHPYLTRMPLEERYWPRPQLRVHMCKAAFNAADWAVATLLLGGLLCCVGIPVGEALRSQGAAAEADRLWDQGDRAGAVALYREVATSHWKLQAVSPDHRVTVFRRIFQVDFHDPATPVLPFLKKVGPPALSTAVRALLEQDWPREARIETAAEVLDRLPISTQLDLAQTMPVARSGEALLALFQSWQRSRTSLEDAQKAQLFRCVRRALGSTAEGGTEAEDVVSHALPYLEPADRLALVETVVGRHLQKGDAERATRFLDRVRHRLGPAQFADARVQALYDRRR